MEMFELANLLAKILDKKLDHHKPNFFKESCSPFNCYLRMNRYPPCPMPRGMFGLVPHTDSNFLTILLQDHQIGGLQFVKDGKWVTVKLNSESLIVIIGDLFQVHTLEKWNPTKDLGLVETIHNFLTSFSWIMILSLPHC